MPHRDPVNDKWHVNAYLNCPSSVTIINTLIKILCFGKVEAVLQFCLTCLWLFVCFPCPVIAFMWAIISRCESERWWNSGRHEETPVRNKIWLHMWRTTLPSHFSTHQPACYGRIPGNISEQVLQWVGERENYPGHRTFWHLRRKGTDCLWFLILCLIKHQFSYCTKTASGEIMARVCQATR